MKTHIDSHLDPVVSPDFPHHSSPGWLGASLCRTSRPQPWLWRCLSWPAAWTTRTRRWSAPAAAQLKSSQSKRPFWYWNDHGDYGDPPILKKRSYRLTNHMYIYTYIFNHIWLIYIYTYVKVFKQLIVHASLYIYTHILDHSYHIYDLIYIYICIYSLVQASGTAQTWIRLVKLVHSVTKFRRGINKFH